MNLIKLYDILIYSENRQDIVDALNYTHSIYDRAKNINHNHGHLVSFFRDFGIKENDVICFNRGDFNSDCFAFLKSRMSWLSAKISMIDNQSQFEKF